MIKTTINGVITEIDSSNIVKLELVSDKKSDPMVSVWVDDAAELKFYNFPASKGYQIHIINEFLKSLNLDDKIEFKSYSQYAELILNCSLRLPGNKKATA